MHYVDRIVTDRVFLLGLDELFRERMKRAEAGELLVAAQEVCGALGLGPAAGPIEGYYTESPELTSYFRLIRALQAVEAQRRDEVEDLAAYLRLVEVTSSPIFGTPKVSDRLLPAARDSLAVALERTPMSEWTVRSLLEAATQVARATNECSLVSLAALSGDAVVLTALRETVVLYVGPVAGASMNAPKPRYLWEVSDEVASRGASFVAQFNRLFSEPLPDPIPEHAALFWHAHDDSSIGGRCVRIGLDDSVQPIRNYHWAIHSEWTGAELRREVHEFWDTRLWTTEAYRSDLQARRFRGE